MPSCVAQSHGAFRHPDPQTRGRRAGVPLCALVGARVAFPIHILRSVWLLMLGAWLAWEMLPQAGPPQSVGSQRGSASPTRSQRDRMRCPILDSSLVVFLFFLRVFSNVGVC